MLSVPCSLTPHHKLQKKKKTSKAVRGESETQEKFVYSSPGRLHGDYRRKKRKALQLVPNLWEGAPRDDLTMTSLLCIDTWKMAWDRKSIILQSIFGVCLKFQFSWCTKLDVNYFCSSPSDHLFFWIDWWRRSFGSLTKIKVQKSKPKCEMMPGSPNLN